MKPVFSLLGDAITAAAILSIPFWFPAAYAILIQLVRG